MNKQTKPQDSKRSNDNLGPSVGKQQSDEMPPLTQREKFIRAARELETDETGEALDEALRAIGRAKRR